MGNLPVYATKGFEYLLILGFLVVFTTFFLYFTSRGFQEEVKAVIQPTIDHLVDWFRVPDNILFHQGHTWAYIKASEPEVVTVGMDDFAHKMAGPMRIRSNPAIGSVVRQGGKGWSLSDGNKSVDMLVPVSGEVVDVNASLLARQKSIAQADSGIQSDPYGEDWILKIKPEDFKRERKGLLSGSLARKWMEGETEQLRQVMGEELGEVMQDGGMPVAGMAKNIKGDEWDLFLKEFFMT